MPEYTLDDFVEMHPNFFTGAPNVRTYPLQNVQDVFFFHTVEYFTRSSVYNDLHNHGCNNNDDVAAANADDDDENDSDYEPDDESDEDSYVSFLNVSVYVIYVFFLFICFFLCVCLFI